MATFPFGAPVLECGTAIPDGERAVFVLGAYPSALHVEWVPPEGLGERVQALPVDNEPEPFWDGTSAESLFEQWRPTFDPDWGEVTLAGRFNGPSGKDIEKRWLKPLGYGRSDAFITDCLPMARMSDGVEKRLADTYSRVVAERGAPPATLKAHPSETGIAREALQDHAVRLRHQVQAARPEVIVTLGNAAARVVAALSGQDERRAILTKDSYGDERIASVDGHRARWQALVHPATPASWMEVHNGWARTR